MNVSGKWVASQLTLQIDYRHSLSNLSTRPLLSLWYLSGCVGVCASLCLSSAVSTLKSQASTLIQFTVSLAHTYVKFCFTCQRRINSHSTVSHSIGLSAQSHFLVLHFYETISFCILASPLNRDTVHWRGRWGWDLDTLLTPIAFFAVALVVAELNFIFLYLELALSIKTFCKRKSRCWHSKSYVSWSSSPLSAAGGLLMQARSAATASISNWAN